MQKLFSMFPPGFPGMALLLLRMSVVLSLLFTDYIYRLTLPGWVHALALAISILLSLGCFTPIAAVTALVFHALLWLLVGVDYEPVAFVYVCDAIALALLGPGAYSIDAYRFGRRLVVLPPP
jgi:uncharacterized membrane protein YphA (DoxX/SURF4 family)